MLNNIYIIHIKYFINIKYILNIAFMLIYLLYLY